MAIQGSSVGNEGLVLMELALFLQRHGTVTHLNTLKKEALPGILRTDHSCQCAGELAACHAALVVSWAELVSG